MLQRLAQERCLKAEAPTTLACVGEHGTLRDVLRSVDCDADLKEPMAELMVFTTEVVGSDGAGAGGSCAG